MSKLACSFLVICVECLTRWAQIQIQIPILYLLNYFLTYLTYLLYFTYVLLYLLTYALYSTYIPTYLTTIIIIMTLNYDCY